MQKVAAYLLERRDGMEVSDQRTLEAQRLQAEAMKWLTSKGATLVGAAGTYKPEDGSKGTFSIEQAEDGDRTWWLLRLQEETAEGRRFSVALSVTSGSDRIAVHVTLEAGWTTTRIMPVSMDPRCPRVVRNLLSLPGCWYHGASTLRELQTVNGFDAGGALAAELKHDDRTIPFVVISTANGKVALPELDSKLAYDLAGLANVVVLDEDAAWALTDEFGQDLCCYWGAVRLYWPHLAANQDRFFHPLWTAERLWSSGHNAIETRDRFRKQLRELLFRAAALSVIRPGDIDEIRDAAGRRALSDLRQRAASRDEFKELVDYCATENDQLHEERTSLRAQIGKLEAQVARLEAQVARLEGARQALVAHLQAAKGASTEAVSAAEDIQPGSAGDEMTAAAGEPTPGEVRFYKKMYSGPSHDVMVHVRDCGCNNWESGHAGDKLARASRS